MQNLYKAYCLGWSQMFHREDHAQLDWQAVAAICLGIEDRDKTYLRSFETFQNTFQTLIKE